MVDAALVYVVGVVVLFFFWMYGIVAFLRDVKNKLLPAYRQWRSETDADDEETTVAGAWPADGDATGIDADHGSEDPRGQGSLETDG